MPVYFKELSVHLAGTVSMLLAFLLTLTAPLKFYRLYLIIYVISNGVVKTKYQGRREVMY